jgi:aspartate racemase
VPHSALRGESIESSLSGREASWRALRNVLQAQRATPPVRRARPDVPASASFGQQRLWFIERLAPDTATNCQTVAFRLMGELSVRALERALSEIVRRHEALRTRLEWAEDRLLQHVIPPSDIAIAIEDLRDLSEPQRPARTEALTRDEATQPFDIDHPPLLRARLLRIADKELRLLLTVQHLAFDGWSFAVLMRELRALYEAFVANARSPLPELPIQYADWAEWQRSCLERSKDDLLRYWRQQMRDAPTLRLPTDYPRRNLPARAGSWLSFEIPMRVAEGLNCVAKPEGATTYAALLAAFQALLYRYTGDEDIVVGSPMANRHHAEVEALIGLIVNTLPIRTRVNGAKTFRALMREVRDTVLCAYEHQELPLELLSEATQAGARSDTTPLFRAMFAFQNLPRWTWRSPELGVEAWNVHNGAAKFDLTLFMWETAHGFGGLLEYDSGLFDVATARQLLEHFKVLLEGVACNPDEELAKVSLLGDAERSHLSTALNRTPIQYERESSIHEVFARRAAEEGQKVALVSDTESLTYAALERRANQLARLLQRMGVERETLVGVCLSRSATRVAAILAVLKAGGAYVPVEPSWPIERLRTILARTAVVIAQEGIADLLRSGGIRVLRLDALSDAIEREQDDPLATSTSANDLAYVMYTSGSTGEPKGVCIPHRAVVRLVRSANYAELASSDVFVQLAPIAFDASTFEIWGALLNGATLAVPAAELEFDAIGAALRRWRVTVLWLTSGLFEAIVDTRLDDLSAVRQLLVGGDVLSSRHAERFIREVPRCRLVNCYGPTENTTFTTYHQVRPSSLVHGASIPIGRPVSNTQVYVLDKGGQPVPMGVIGEACLGGDGLMRGYLDDPARTNERLVRNPFPEGEGDRLYRTGDIVRWRRDGELEFLGRCDDQVKIRGFRVEAAEVETAIAACPAVRSVAVVASGDPANKRLCAFIVPISNAATREDPIRNVRELLRRRLPAYLIPTEFCVVDSLPLDGNGKLDRRALGGMAEHRAGRTIAAEAARDETERRIVQAFEAILDTRPIGIHDDFFDCGGSSLSALRLVATLEDAFGTSLPLASLYEHSTPAALAIALGDLARSPSCAPRALDAGTSLLIEIRSGNATPPLFLVPGGHGGMPEMTLYAQVASHFRHERPVYGFIARGSDGREPPHASVEEMADAYIEAMRKLQPHGPYLLAGECVGGLIAFEMARRLERRGDQIMSLLLLDTWCPTIAGVMHYRYVERTATLFAARRAVARRGLADVRRVLDEHVRDRPPFGLVRTPHYAVNVVRTLARVARPWIAAVAAVGKPAAGRERIAAVEANYVERAMRYRPQRFGGRVSIIVCAENERRGLAKPWHALAGEVKVTTVQGDHDTYLKATPDRAAAALEQCIDETIEGQAACAAPVLATEAVS